MYGVSLAVHIWPGTSLHLGSGRPGCRRGRVRLHRGLRDRSPSWLPLMVQTVILAAVIGLVIWFHGVIPVPAGVVSPGVGP